MDNLSNIKVRLSRDAMSAFVTIGEPADGRVPTKGDIMDALAQNNVAHGIIEAEVDEIASRGLPVEDRLIARGDQPEHGKDGYVEYLFSFSKEIAPKVLPDGRVDYYDMNVVHPAMKGEALCRLHHPVPGVNGSNVLGLPIAARNGKHAKLPRGRNTRVNDEGDALIADIDGQIYQNGNNIDIVQEFEVKENVDFSIGNIRFPGSVNVKGNVQSGFIIQSGGDVTVHGRVENASITAVGNIILHGGMTGQGSGLLRAGGNVFAKYVENSRITASGNVTAECIMHSVVRSGESIELIGKKGLLVGGSAKAREQIKAVTIGSQFATNTEVEVGNDPKLNDRLNDINAEAAAMETELAKTAQIVQMFDNIIKSGGSLTAQKALVHEKAAKQKKELGAKLAALKAEKREIETALVGNVKGFIRASNVIYSGVKVSIANFCMTLKEDIQHCTLVNDGDGIRVAPY